jgi:phosphoribosylanthranilate isomerase
MVVGSARELLSRARLVQVAGVIDGDEARLLVDCGVDLLGFPLRIPHYAADAGEVEADAIIAGIRPPNFGVLITYLESATELLSLCRAVRAPIVQLHGGIAVDELRRFRASEPGLVLVKTLVVRDGNLEALAGEVERTQVHVDAFLMDTFDRETGRWGATGKTHDWSVSRRIVETSPKPVLLAGGLNPENVRRAILEVGPAGVDVHTGVEDTAGRKNRTLVERFVAEATRSFEAV